MAAKSALVTGITGQDGSYLAEFLLGKGYRVCGMVRRSSTDTFQRIEHIRNKIELHQADLLDQTSIAHVLAEVQHGLWLSVQAEPALRPLHDHPDYLALKKAHGPAAVSE